MNKTDKTQHAKLEVNEFHYLDYDSSGEPNAIRFRHPNCKFNACTQKITRGQADASTNTWHWDGNTDKPTLTPSIGCDARCGCHFNIVSGNILT